MKRELAYALEARSQFGCFGGRTRSSNSPSVQFSSSTRKKNKEKSSVVRCGKVDDEVVVDQQRKRAKTVVSEGDLVNVGESDAAEVGKIGDESTAAELVTGEEGLEIVTVEVESTTAEVAEKPATAEVEIAGGEMELAMVEVRNSEEELAIAEVSMDEEKDKKLVQKVYVKRKKQKIENTPKRFTRSALKDEKVEELVTPTRKKMELKMSKKIGLERVPTNLRDLLETGLLEGFRVYYNRNNEGKNLQGRIKGAGILCSCDLCRGTKVISPSQFELHAIKAYKRAVKHICLENGKSLLEVIEVCKASALETLEVAIQAVISSSFPEKESSVCTGFEGSIEPSSAEFLLICDSSMVQAEQKDATCEEVRTSSPVQNPLASTSSPISSNRKRKRGRPKFSESTPKATKSSANPKSTLKSTKSSANPKSSRNKIKVKQLRRSTRSTESTAECTTSQQKSRTNLSRSKLTMKNHGMHWAVFDEGGLPDGTELTYVNQGKKLLDGYKLGRGIFCFCCNTEVSASVFEGHAGWATRKKPYENIYISNGVSLHEYAVSLKKNQRCPLKFNDDLCRICGDGGDLLLCDGCPRSFHPECASEPSVPRGKWYCKICLNALKITSRENQNALVAGRVTGIDPIEQITQRCIRIVKNPENNDLVSCVLCRGHDFSKNVFNERTVIVCDQCEREYHIGCLKEHDMADLKALPKGKWYCCKDCERIYGVIKDLLTQEPKKLPEDLLNITIEKQKTNNEDGNDIGNSEIKFMLLSGKNASRETRSLLVQTVHIFQECFDPIIDASTGRDFIPSMVYGKKIWSQDFAGMLCAILIIDSKVVSAGTLRVFGQSIAELPIVATTKCNQGKGYFQVLFGCVERLLSSLKIKKIVLPAADEAKSIWTNKFGFEIIDSPELKELRQTCSAMMTFKGTSMLQKEVPQNDSDDNSIFNIPSVGEEEKEEK